MWTWWSWSYVLVRQVVGDANCERPTWHYLRNLKRSRPSRSDDGSVENISTPLLASIIASRCGCISFSRASHFFCSDWLSWAESGRKNCNMTKSSLISFFLQYRKICLLAASDFKIDKLSCDKSLNLDWRCTRSKAIWASRTDLSRDNKCRASIAAQKLYSTSSNVMLFTCNSALVAEEERSKRTYPSGRKAIVNLVNDGRAMTCYLQLR